MTTEVKLNSTVEAVQTTRYAALNAGAPPLDGRAVEVTQSILPEWTSYLFAAVTLLGEAWIFVPVLALAYWFGDAERIAPLFGLVFGGLALIVVFKSLFALPRPPTEAMIPPEAAHESIRSAYAWAIHSDGYGFPSGHTVGAVVMWGALALRLHVGTPTVRIGVAVTLVFLAALSRLALGVHYLADVIGGFVIGLVLLLAWLAALDHVTRPVELSLGAGICCAILPLLLGVGGSEPLYALGAISGALLAWTFVGPPGTRFDRTVSDIGVGFAGVVWFLGAGITVGILIPGAVGSVLMTAVMGLAIFTWPHAVGRLRSWFARAVAAS